MNILILTSGESTRMARYLFSRFARDINDFLPFAYTYTEVKMALEKGGVDCLVVYGYGHEENFVKTVKYVIKHFPHVPVFWLWTKQNPQIEGCLNFPRLVSAANDHPGTYFDLITEKFKSLT